MKPASRKAYSKRVYQAATQLIFSSYRAGSISEAEYERLLKALEAINSDRLNPEELMNILELEKKAESSAD